MTQVFDGVSQNDVTDSGIFTDPPFVPPVMFEVSTVIEQIPGIGTVPVAAGILFRGAYRTAVV